MQPSPAQGAGATVLAETLHPTSGDPNEQVGGLGGKGMSECGDVVAGAASGQTMSSESGLHGSAGGDDAINAVGVVADTAGAAAPVIVTAPTETTSHLTTGPVLARRGSHCNRRRGPGPT